MLEKESKRKEVRDSQGNTEITGGGAPWQSRCPLQSRSRADEYPRQEEVLRGAAHAEAGELERGRREVRAGGAGRRLGGALP